ncbi:multicopper oxidase family protein [Streptomyces halobius]|uniref:Multicopper oxidase family protein n=1 Tax=Streptomyces halobius TaxID=2879846 RepID=A0ABY4M4E3_9ACTN|nr:multicopper oxidase family protein [Streptomyces halobius]UQA91106.1 multicopper oxidase family protein [Streptomyces halobius]
MAHEHRAKGYRRRSLLMGAGAVGGIGLLGGAEAAFGGGSSEEEGEPLRDLPEVRSKGGLLDYRLTMTASTVSLGHGRKAHVHTYNDSLPGPVLRIRPGDRMRLLVRNRMLPMGVPLNALPPLCATRPGPAEAVGLARGVGSENHSTLTCLPQTAMNVVAGKTIVQLDSITNLHTHGLQVSPEEPADNVFLVIPPLGSHQFAFHIRRHQPAGLYWYHPHFHGATAHQGFQGLAGPIVVEGDIDEVPELADAAERILVLQELWLDEHGEVPNAVPLPSGGPVPFTSVPAVPTEWLFTVNGQLTPEVRMRPGEVQRWRVLNAAPHRLMWLHVDQHTLHQVGQDGVPFAHARPKPAIMLAPANRAEFAVRAGEPGRYPIYIKAYDQGRPGGARPTRLLATLVVDGPPAHGRLPTKLVRPPRMPHQPVVRRRKLVFKGDISGRYGLGVRFFIDGREFDQGRVDQHVEAGTVEEWRIVNEDVFQHPFHIHVNPFQVTDVRGVPHGDPSFDADPTVWWDTFRIPPLGEFTMRTYFHHDLPGLSVYHCHMLNHEDAGMMGTVLISPPGSGDPSNHLKFTSAGDHARKR